MLVQIYALGVIAFSLYIGYTKHGEPIELPDSDHDFRRTFMSLMLHLPMFGRVFNWW